MTDAVVAVDVGGTSIKGLMVDVDGRTRAEAVRPTPVADGPEAVVRAVRETVATLAQPSTGDVHLRAVGLAVPGEIDPAAHVARYSANLGWRDVSAVDLAGPAARGLPAVVAHDVGCAALADRAFGASHGVKDTCVIVIGTGIASVSTARGAPVKGARGTAGELGHVPVHPGGEACACGQRGCLETYASAAAIARRYRARPGRDLTAEQIAGRLTVDDDAATVWREAVGALATACVTVTMIDDPEVIVLAGGLAEAGAALIDPLRVAVADGIAWRPPPRLELSPLGARAGRVGIAIRAWQAAGVDGAVAGLAAQAAS